jgi:hypothetical protein
MPQVDKIASLNLNIILPDDGGIPLCRDPQTGKTALRLVTMGKNAYPVVNYTCPLCTFGWAAKNGHNKIAIYQQHEFHRDCLRAQLGEPKFSDLVASKDLILEG